MANKQIIHLVADVAQARILQIEALSWHDGHAQAEGHAEGRLDGVVGQHAAGTHHRRSHHQTDLAVKLG